MNKKRKVFDKKKKILPLLGGAHEYLLKKIELSPTRYEQIKSRQFRYVELKKKEKINKKK